MTSTVPRLGRALDLLGILLLIVGGACWFYAYTGFESLRAPGFVPEPIMFAALLEAERYTWISRLGMLLASSGVAVAVAAFVIARRRGAPVPPRAS
jgi:drug/metabolite transporter (DMT)-like permease